MAKYTVVANANPFGDEGADVTVILNADSVENACLKAGLLIGLQTGKLDGETLDFSYPLADSVLELCSIKSVDSA